MPKPTNLEKHQPRRDGKFERLGTWGEVTVGSVIFGPTAGERRHDLWEIVAEAAGSTPAGNNKTLWFRAREVNGDREVTISPKAREHRVTFVCDSPDDLNPLPPRGEVADKAALDLLAETLGASVLHSRDNTTGEIICPNYDTGGFGGEPTQQWYNAEEREHLRRYHSIDASAMDIPTMVNTHSDAHRVGSDLNRASPVPHRHGDWTIDFGRPIRT